MKQKDRQTEYDEISDADNKVIVATYGVASVGINIPRIFNLVMLEPGKSFVRVVQSIGRGIRKASDKDYLNVVDITSNLKYSKRHLTKRKAFYKDQGFPFKVTKVEYK
jgi:superfamily II DNA or RNA helicase